MESWSSPAVPVLPGRGEPVLVADSASGALAPLSTEAVSPLATCTMYVCGITPYDATHLGHAATYVTFDVLARTLRDSGIRVRYVQNVTDVDDPLLIRAKEISVDWKELAAREIALFRTDMTALRVQPPERYVGAVEAIPDIVPLIGALLDAGAAYVLDGDVYFAVASAPRLGSVSGLDRTTMVALSRERGGDPDRPGKKDPLDALMWRAQRPDEPSWPSPFGPGRPGWHVECAAIAMRHLGSTIGVQGGGRDLVFPHHELGAAHAEVASGQIPFAHTYVHQAMVGFEGHKMSKSRGNLVLVSALRAAGVDPMAIRLGLLAFDHRGDWEWTDAVLTEAQQRLDRWRAAASLPRAPGAEGTLARMRSALAGGLDTPGALAAAARWVAAALAGATGDEPGAAGLFGHSVDALLGIAL